LFSQSISPIGPIIKTILPLMLVIWPETVQTIAANLLIVLAGPQRRLLGRGALFTRQGTFFEFKAVLDGFWSAPSVLAPGAVFEDMERGALGF
jgi:hypothetical protein